MVRVKCIMLLYVLILLCGSETTQAQDTIKFETIHSIRDIPHRTLKQKWMWIHRSIVFGFMKDRMPTNDTSYYSSYQTKLVTLTVPVSTRFINFKLRDGVSSNFLKFEPNNQYNVGISINSRFASFLINTGVSLSDANDDIKGKTHYNDYQFNLYSKKSTVDLSYQTYKGFYIENASKFDNYSVSRQLPYEIRPDVSVYAMSLNHYFLFNNNRFSYRSSFAFNERQKKRAGSLLLGGYMSLFGIRADSSLVSEPFSQYFAATAHIKSATVFNFGLNLGYIYTLIIRKKFYATLSLVQGLGFAKTSTQNEANYIYESDLRFSSKQNVRVALGYDNKKFFAGTLGIYDFYYFNDQNSSTVNYSYGKFRIFGGYRFSIEKQQRKFLRKLNLIDYRL